MRTNYHTHTTRCNHAINNERQYIEHAIQGGYDLLGFSDHTPWPFANGYYSHIRMRVKQLEEYVATIRSLAVEYAPQIEIRLGLECEYYTDHTEWLRETKEAMGLDYLLLGNHFLYSERGQTYQAEISTPAEIKRYAECAIKAMESGLYNCMAHPDLYMRGYRKADNYATSAFRDMATTAQACGVVMELNTSMPFTPELWQIVAEVGTPVIVGMDAHESIILSSPTLYDKAIANMQEMGVNLIYNL